MVAYHGLLGLVCAVCITGCSRQAAKQLPPFIVVGRGFTNEVEVGMTLREVSKNRPDLTVSVSRMERWPFGDVLGYSAAVPGSGVSFKVPSQDEPITRLVVDVNPALSANRFFGKLSCHLSFERGQIVSRKQVTDVLGNPSQPGTSNVLSYLESGKSVAWVPGPGTEILYYPTSGVIFHLTGGTVDLFTITKPHTSSAMPKK